MAVTVISTWADTTEQTVYSAAAYLKGVFASNPGLTATEGWILLYDGGTVTPGTTVPDLVLWVPWNNMNKTTFRFELPRLYFATNIQAFHCDTSGNNASAWNGGTGSRLEFYFEPVA